MLSVVPGSGNGVFVDPMCPWRIRKVPAPAPRSFGKRRPQRPKGGKGRRRKCSVRKKEEEPSWCPREACKKAAQERGVPYASILRLLADEEEPVSVLREVTGCRFSFPAESWNEVLKWIDGVDEEVIDDFFEDFPEPDVEDNEDPDIFFGKIDVSPRVKAMLCERFSHPRTKRVLVSEFRERKRKPATGRPAYARACAALGVAPRSDVAKQWSRKTLDLRGSYLTFDEASAVACGLASNRTIRHLKIDNVTAAVVLKTLSTSFILVLDASRSDLDVAGVAAVCQHIPKLKELYVNDNAKVGDAGAELLAEAIVTRWHGSFKTLCLARCAIQRDGGAALGLALDSVSSLTRDLDVSFNDLGGGAILWGATTSVLQTLNVSFCGLTDDAAEALAYVVARASSLRALDASLNRLGSKAGFAVASALRSSTSVLKTLRLGFQQLGADASLALAASVETHATLSTLAIENATVAGQEQTVIDVAALANESRDLGDYCEVCAEFPKRQRIVVARSVDVAFLALEKKKKSNLCEEDTTIYREEDLRQHRHSSAYEWVAKAVCVENRAATMTEKLAPLKEEVAAKKEPWRLRESSLWRKRCGHFFETPERLRDLARRDLDLTKVRKTMPRQARENIAVYEELVCVTAEHFQDLDLIHREYAAYGEATPFALQWNEWRDLAKNLGLLAGCSLEEIDLVFVAANVGKNTSETKDQVMTRPEFIEAIARVAFRRYADQEPADALKSLLTNDVLPRAHAILKKGDQWRADRLYTEEVDDVLTKYKPLCQKLWAKAKTTTQKKARLRGKKNNALENSDDDKKLKRKKKVLKQEAASHDDDDHSVASPTRSRRTSFSEAGNTFQANAHNQKVLSLDDWLRLAESARGRLANVEARVAFVLSTATRPSPPDSSKQSDHVYLSGTDFLELLCRTSEVLDPDDALPVDAKLPRLLEILARGNGLFGLFKRLRYGDRETPVLFLASDLDDLKAKAMEAASLRAEVLHRRRTKRSDPTTRHARAIKDRRHFLEHHRYFQRQTTTTGESPASSEDEQDDDEDQHPLSSNEVVLPNKKKKKTLLAKAKIQVSGRDAACLLTRDGQILTAQVLLYAEARTLACSSTTAEDFPDTSDAAKSFVDRLHILNPDGDLRLILPPPAIV